MVMMRAHVRMLDLDQRRVRLVPDEEHAKPMEVGVDASALAGVVYALTEREPVACEVEDGVVTVARVARKR